ncbi:MAG TPA: NADH-quinone oxidoreductase subunit J [Polyangiales bacterium]|jgi:NADH-quinone oxidoreductase subunit J|nr:NADH-quinone oxidoreductase subunit J [Polyangiales bacterium]
MTVGGQALFFMFAFVALLSALGTVSLHSPIRAAMALLAHIVSLSGLFLLLHAHLLAALQVLVYAGAVVVLFVFVIMMIGPSAPEPPVQRGMVMKAGAIAIMIIMTALLAFSLMPETRPLIALGPCTDLEGAECDQFGGVVAFAQSLFRSELVPFELISVLLTVAIVGAIAVARGRTAAETAALRRRLESDAAARLATEARERALSAEVSAHGGH